MKYCPKCGTEVEENDKFCPNCGESLSEKPVKKETCKGAKSALTFAIFSVAFSTFGITGLGLHYLSIVFAIPGLILSISNMKRSKSICMVALIISILTLVSFVIYFILSLCGIVLSINL